MPEPNGTMNIAGWGRFIAVVGIPGVIALFLVYTGASSLPAIQQDIMLTRLSAERAQTMHQEQLLQNQQLIRAIQRLCSIIARTDEERQRCFTE